MALTDNNIAWYALDEASGDVIDSSVNNNHATNSGCTRDQAGLIDKSFSFDGVNDLIDLDDKPVPIGNSARSISLWVKFDHSDYGSGALVPLLRTGSEALGKNFSVALTRDGTTDDFRIYLRRYINDQATEYVTLTTNTWNHLVITYDGTRTASGLKFYINGTNIAKASEFDDDVTFNTGDAVQYLGSVPALWTTDTFNGFMDEVGIWSRELSSSEVTELYNSGNGKNPYDVDDIVIDDTTITDSEAFMTPSTLVWIDENNGYVFFIDNNSYLNYKKTTDGGSTWSTKVTITTDEINCVSVWYDRWTNGDTGDLIHIAFINYTQKSISYNSLDTTTDTLGGEVIAYQGTTHTTTYAWTQRVISITKSRSGNIYIAGGTNTNENAFVKSNSSPATNFTTKSNAFISDHTNRIILQPGNETDTDDIWSIFWEELTDTIHLRVYDQSADSWSSTTIESFAFSGSGKYYQMDAVHRHSDNHTILAHWTSFGGDLQIWDIGGPGSITQKTNVLTSASEGAGVSILINQYTDDLYVSYLDGTAFGSLLGAHYKKTTDGGTTWGAVQHLSVGAESDLTLIISGTSIRGNGRFMPAWFINIPLYDLRTNKNNSIEFYVTIPTTQATNITYSNNEGITLTADWTRGDGDKLAVFMKETTTGSASPVDETTYTGNSSFGSGTQIGSTGWYCVYNGTGTTVDITNLTEKTDYRIMACEYNGEYADEVYLTDTSTENPVNEHTVAEEPSTQATNIIYSNVMSTSATISWVNGNGSKRLVFVKQTDTGVPVPINGTDYIANTIFGSGGQIGSTGWYCVYNGTGTTVDITGLTSGQTYRTMVVEANE